MSGPPPLTPVQPGKKAEPLGPITDRDWMLFDLFSAGRLITDQAWMRVPKSWQREAIASGTVITFRARAGVTDRGNVILTDPVRLNVVGRSETVCAD